jgi:hypothetical protein
VELTTSDPSTSSEFTKLELLQGPENGFGKVGGVGRKTALGWGKSWGLDRNHQGGIATRAGILG